MEVKSKYPKTVEPLLLRLVQILNSGKKNALAEKISRRKSSTSFHGEPSGRTPRWD